MELVGQCASQALIVSCTGDCAWVRGGGLRAVGDHWAPGGLLAADCSGAVVLVWFLLNDFGVGVLCRDLYSFVVCLCKRWWINCLGWVRESWYVCSCLPVIV